MTTRKMIRESQAKYAGQAWDPVHAKRMRIDTFDDVAKNLTRVYGDWINTMGDQILKMNGPQYVVHKISGCEQQFPCPLVKPENGIFKIVYAIDDE